MWTFVRHGHGTSFSVRDDNSAKKTGTFRCNRLRTPNLLPSTDTASRTHFFKMAATQAAKILSASSVIQSPPCSARFAALMLLMYTYGMTSCKLSSSRSSLTLCVLRNVSLRTTVHQLICSALSRWGVPITSKVMSGTPRQVSIVLLGLRCCWDASRTWDDQSALPASGARKHCLHKSMVYFLFLLC